MIPFATHAFTINVHIFCFTDGSGTTIHDKSEAHRGNIRTRAYISDGVLSTKFWTSGRKPVVKKERKKTQEQNKKRRCSSDI